MGFGSNMHDNDPEIIEREKKRNLTGKTPPFIPDTPGWNQYLASDSEAAVHAERYPAEQDPLEKLQEVTIEVVQEVVVDPDAIPVKHHFDPSIYPDIKESVEKSKPVRTENKPASSSFGNEGRVVPL
eukprot:jgi/Chrzof1/14941/Cz09g21170.t1